jgi:hypothetical protein
MQALAEKKRASKRENAKNRSGIISESNERDGENFW